MKQQWARHVHATPPLHTHESREPQLSRAASVPSSPCPLSQPVNRQEPRLRRLHVRTAMPIKMDPERPEYHRAVAHWARPGAPPLAC